MATAEVTQLHSKIENEIKQAYENYAFLEWAARLQLAEFFKQREKVHDTEKKQFDVLTALSDDLLALRAMQSEGALLQSVEKQYSDLIRRHDQVQSMIVRKIRSELDDEEASNPSDERAQLLAKETAQLSFESEREAALRRLETDVMDIHAIYSQLAAQINEQARHIDTIAEHVESSYEEVDSARKELEEAEEYRRRTRRFWLILGLVIGGILVILLVVILVQLLR